MKHLFRYIPIPETLILSIMLITLFISCGCSDKKPVVVPYGATPSSVIDNTDGTATSDIDARGVVYE